MIALRSSGTPYWILAAAVLIAFAAAAGASFHFDDYSLFVDPYVTAGSGWWEVWRFDQSRPLTYFTFWANYQIGGRDPTGYHVVNVAVHLASTMLLFGILRGLLPDRTALIGAALFAIHPVQTEPVVYIHARATLLMAFFCLLAWRDWMAGHVWRAALWFGVALLAKEECAAFPLFLLLLVWSQRATEPRRIEVHRRALAAIGVMIVMAVAAGARVIWAASRLDASGAGSGSLYSPLQYLITQGLVILRYFRLLLVPVGFTVDPDISVAGFWTGLAAWVVVGVLAWFAARRFARCGPGLWFLGGLLLLLPSSSIFPADDVAADRRMCLPLIAFGPAVAWFLARARPYIPGVLGVVLVALTAGRVQVWQTERSLWTEAVERAPEKIRPRIQLARSIDTTEAIRLLEDTKSLAPSDARLASELGSRYLEAGRSAEALAEFGRALALEPDSPYALNNRGVALSALGQREAAQMDFERALEISTCFFDARLNLARLGLNAPPASGCRFTPEQQEALAQLR